MSRMVFPLPTFLPKLPVKVPDGARNKKLQRQLDLGLELASATRLHVTLGGLLNLGKKVNLLHGLVEKTLF